MIDETLSPTWDELLIVDEAVLYGTKDDIKRHPPAVVVEIFDQDKVVTVVWSTIKVLTCEENVLTGSCVFVCAGQIRIYRQDSGQTARETSGRRVRSAGISGVPRMV